MAKKIRKFFRRLGENRTLLLGVVFLAMFAVLIGRLFILQVVHGEEYADNFELQITKTRTLESTRGNIYDRNGKLIAGNKVSYSVTIEDNGTYNTTKERILSLNAELYRLCKLIRANGDSIDTSTFPIEVDENGAFVFTGEEGTTRDRFRADIYGQKKIDDMTAEQKSSSAETLITFLAGPDGFGLDAYSDDEKYAYSAKDFEEYGLPYQTDESGNAVLSLSNQERLEILVIRYKMKQTNYQKYVRVTVASGVSSNTTASIAENEDVLQGVSISEDSERVYYDGKYFSSLIVDECNTNASALEYRLKYMDVEAVLNKLLEIKTEAKKTCKEFILSNTGVEINENSIYDIQIKRLHEYKRQQLNALYIISKYLEIKGGKKPSQPVTFIFGAKAAPAYVIAKDIIHLLLTLQDLIKDDPEVAPYMKLVMVENYNVSAAEKLFPACDISEQISLASKEASGTGNMKFMLNGAVTLGTMDGANVEISELVGEDNINIFGESSEKVIEHYEKADYCSRDIYENDKRIKECVDFIVSEKMLALGHKENLERLHHELVSKDWFMTLLDFNDYVEKKDQALADYADRKTWAKKMLVNIAKAGFFSSDRTIEQYNNDIWHLTPAK